MRLEQPHQRAAGWLGLAAGVGLLGAANDQIHVQSGLLSYPDPWLFGQAAWVPLNFAVLLTSLLAVTALLAHGRALGPAPAAVRIVADLAWFVGAYALSGVVAPDHPGLLALAFVALWVPRVAIRPERGFLALYGIGLALAGCAVEAAEIGLGWFGYAEADVAGVPFWLAGIYLHGAPLALDVARRVDAAGLIGARPAPA